MLAQRFQASWMRESRRVQSVRRAISNGWPQQDKKVFSVRDFLFEGMLKAVAQRVKTEWT
jgi:hypothetical protein